MESRALQMWDGKCPERSSYEDKDMDLCLKMEGLPPGPRLFKELGARSGFALTGEEADEGLNELVRAPRLVNSKSYVRLRSSEPSAGELYGL